MRNFVNSTQIQCTEFLYEFHALHFILSSIYNTIPYFIYFRKMSCQLEYNLIY